MNYMEFQKMRKQAAEQSMPQSHYDNRVAEAPMDWQDRREYMQRRIDAAPDKETRGRAAHDYFNFVAGPGADAKYGKWRDPFVGSAEWYKKYPYRSPVNSIPASHYDNRTTSEAPRDFVSRLNLANFDLLSRDPAVRLRGENAYDALTSGDFYKRIRASREQAKK